MAKAVTDDEALADVQSAIRTENHLPAVRHFKRRIPESL